MGNMLTMLGSQVIYIILGQCILSVLLMVLLIINMVQNQKWKRKYNRFMMGKDCESMEEMIAGVCRDVNEIKGLQKQINERVDMVTHSVKSSYKRIGIVRYDAFKGMKGKLSFAICLLDDFDSGFILNSMKGVEGNYTYMKEIIHGKSIVALGEEEKQALEEAMQNEKYE